MKTEHKEVVAQTKAEFDRLSEKIVRLITADNSAFRIVDRPEFRDLFPPHTRIPSRYHLSKNVMPAMVDELRETIREVSFSNLIYTFS